MRYKEHLAQELKKQAVKEYAMLPFGKAEITMVEAVFKGNYPMSPFEMRYKPFVDTINRLVALTDLDFDKNAKLEDIVKMLK